VETTRVSRTNQTQNASSLDVEPQRLGSDHLHESPAAPFPVPGLDRASADVRRTSAAVQSAPGLDRLRRCEDSGQLHAPAAEPAVIRRSPDKLIGARGPQVDADQQPVPSYMQVPTNVVFGLQNRTTDQIEIALQQGYRTFDGADTYGGTMAALAEAVANRERDGAAIPREEMNIVYKVSGEIVDEDLYKHVSDVADLFGGYLDHVLIHKAKHQGLHEQGNLAILRELRTDKKATHIGAGDATVDQVSTIDDLDSFEMPVQGLMNVDGSGTDVAAALKATKKPVFVYNLMRELDALYDDEAHGTPEARALLDHLRVLVPSAEPIASSSNQERNQANLTVLGDPNFEDEQLAPRLNSMIEGRMAREVHELGDMPQLVADQVRTIAQRRTEQQWLECEDRTEELAVNLATIDETELNVVYREVDSGKILSLKQWLVLLHSDKSCDVVDGWAFVALLLL
jgi:diketogulonate reductase-like aldo/keto reductase